MTITRLVFFAGADAPWPFLRASEDGEVLQRGVIPVGAPPQDNEDLDRLVAPGSDALARWLDLPDRNDIQARSAVTFLLQDEIIESGSELHVAIGAADAGDLRLAVVTRMDVVRDWFEQARSRGVEPVSITPDYLLLPEPEGPELVTARFGDLMAVRGERLAFALEPDLAEAVIAGRPCRRLMLADLEKDLALNAARPAINLLQGVLDPNRPVESRTPWRRAVIMAALLLVSPLVLLLGEIGRDYAAIWSAERGIRTTLSAAYPAIARSEDPVAATRARLDQLRSADRFPELAAGLFAVVEKVSGAQLDTLSYSETGGLQARVSCTNYSDMDQLKATGRAMGLDIRQGSTVTEGARITSELSIGRLP